MEHHIENIGIKFLVGKHMTMSFAHNTTGELWRSFMPHRGDIPNLVGTDLYSLQVYRPGFFIQFNPKDTFEKWALAEVSAFGDVPEDMEKFTLVGGMYAVFVYKGNPKTAAPIFQYILGEWLPESPYVLDNRPHFEILGPKYINDDPLSEEELWIPVVYP